MGLYSFVPKKKTKVSAQTNLTLSTSNSQVSGVTFYYIELSLTLQVT